MTYRDEVYFECQPEKEVPFSSEEFANRLQRVREYMSNANIDCLYLTAPSSMYYISGYQCEWYQSDSPKEWPATGGIAVHVDYDKYILFDSEREAILGRVYTNSTDTRFFPRESYRDGSKFVVDELKSEGWLSGNVGLEYWSHRPNRAVSERFQKNFEQAGVTVIDGSDVLRDVRWIKSKAEIECLERAAAITDIGLKAARDTIQPGVTELKVYGAMVQAMAAAGGENPGITMPVLSGKKANCGHALASTRKIQAGEIVFVDVCGVYKRYHMNAARTFSLGEPQPDVVDIANRVKEAAALLKATIRPNLPVKELNQTMLDYYQTHELWDRRGWLGGYEMGIAFPPDWVGNFVYDLQAEKNADKIFEAGTAVNYEHQFFLPRHVGMLFQIDSIVYKDQDASVQSGLPDGLTIIE